LYIFREAFLQVQINITYTMNNYYTEQLLQVLLHLSLTKSLYLTLVQNPFLPHLSHLASESWQAGAGGGEHREQDWNKIFKINVWKSPYRNNYLQIVLYTNNLALLYIQYICIIFSLLCFKEGSSTPFSR
jgi:hypothetical protein